MTDKMLKEFGTELDDQLVEPLRNILIGRRLVNVSEPQGFGISAIQWGTITDMSDGKVSYAFTDGNEDVVDVTPKTARVPVYWKDFKIDRRIFEAFKNGGVDIDTATALSAAYKAAKAEDEAIINGISNDGTNYDFEGLYQASTTDMNTSLDFGTFGNASDAVSNCLDELDDVGVPTNIPFNLTLNNVQRNELRKSRSTNGIKEEPDVRDMLNGGSILSTTCLDEGTGMLSPTPAAGKPFFDFYLTKDWGSELGYDSEHPDTGPISGRVYSAGVLRMKHPEAVVTMSDI